ncbi:MAG: ligase [Rhodospirillales bacterium]|nr:ligase [Rhodospirillales bacterium]
MNDAGRGDASPSLAESTFSIITVAFALAGPLLSAAPLGMSPLLIASALLAYAAERFQSGSWPPLPTTVLIVFSAFIVWCGLSLIWDLNPASGARKLVDVTAVALSLLALLSLGERASPWQRRRLCKVLIGGVAAGFVLLAIETLFDFPLYRLVMGSANPKLADLVEAKRSVDALPLLVWPACFALARLGLPWIGVIVAALFSVACIKLTASSATLGMFFSLVVFAISFFSVTWVRRLLALGTVLAFILVIPVAIIGYDEGGTASHWLKHSAQHRVEIWHFAAERSLERPGLGYGFNASRYVPNGDAVSAFLPPGQSLIPLHPHNAFLQIWLEIGAVGALIVASGLLAMLRAVGRWPMGMARFILSGYAAGIVVAALAFGIWQSWWMATLAFSVATYRMIGPGQEHG